MTIALYRRLWKLAAVLAVANLCLSSAASALTLVDNGRPQAVLVLTKEAHAYEERPLPQIERWEPKDPVAYEKRAAVEIQEHVRKISGATLEIVQAGANLKRLNPIFIGQAADLGLDGAIGQKSKDLASFALAVSDGQASVRGLSPQGTLFGAYELLEQLGVRWFIPGDLGMVLPEAKTVELKQQMTIQAPSFPARQLQAVRAPQWECRMRLGGLYFPSSHGIPGLGPREGDRLIKDHPEWFSLIGGVRKNKQVCISNPEALAHAVEATKAWFRANSDADMIGMGANDGRSFCECEQCRALDGGDYDPFGHFESMTDRYVWFFSRVLEGIEDEFPDKRIGFYAYSVYNRPPVKVKPDPRIVPAVALITLCRMHGMNNPICPEKSYENRIIQQWGQIVPEVYYRGYWFNLADPGLPFFMISRIRQEVPLGKKLGIAGWRVEAPYEWAGSAPSRYIAAKLMWNHDADVDALLKDFYEKFFGPAAKPMQRYIETMDKARHDADYHTGCSWDMPHVYSPAVRAEAGKALEEAAKLAPEGIYAKRVEMYCKNFAYLEAFVTMLERRAAHDYAAAKVALDQIVAIRQELLDNDPPLIGRKAEEYMDRFFSETTKQGYERTTNGNEFVAGLGDEWLFQIDPERIGEDIGWWKPESTSGNWLPIKTTSSTWSNQGLRYYKGLAWYRQTVTIPEKFEGKRIFLWFGAIDELAKVWVNGKAIGISPRITFKPFELDATDAVQAGKPNVVAVCIRNEQLNELGTGGIMGPVMFYAPAADKDAELRNTGPLGKTFPEY